MKGTVSFQGQKVSKGKITFDASNVNRKMVGAVTAPIDENGAYEIKTLVGENQVSFSLAETQGADKTLGYLRLPKQVVAGESTIDFDLPPKP